MPSRLLASHPSRQPIRSYLFRVIHSMWLAWTPHSRLSESEPTEPHVPQTGHRRKPP